MIRPSAPGERRGGRQKGTPNKRPVGMLAAVKSMGITPLEYMLKVLHAEESSSDDRKWAAQQAAPYIHQKLAPAERFITIELPPTDTPEGISKAISVITEKVGTGTITAGQGKNLASLLETRLKAIEVIELEQRIAELERKST